MFTLLCGCAGGDGSYADDSAYDYSIPDGCRVWYMADSGVTADSSGAVSLWSDRSGNGFDLAQGDASLMPQLADNMIHGRRAVHFGGSAFMQAAGSPLFTHSSDAGFAAFAVVRMDEAGTWQGVFSLVRDDDIKPFVLHNMGEALRFSLLVTSADIDSNYLNTEFGLGKFKVVSCLYTPGEELDMVNLKIDGALKSVMSRSITSTGSASMFVGRSPRNTSPPYFSGYIAEIIMYDRGLTDIEIQQVECYLWHKYNIECEGCNE